MADLAIVVLCVLVLPLVGGVGLWIFLNWLINGDLDGR